jgi:beta-N-acetylhexosaminidase
MIKKVGKIGAVLLLFVAFCALITMVAFRAYVCTKSMNPFVKNQPWLIHCVLASNTKAEIIPVTPPPEPDNNQNMQVEIVAQHTNTAESAYQAAAHPSAPTAVLGAQSENIDVAVKTMTLSEKIHTLFIIHTPGQLISNWEPILTQSSPSGIILMGDNISYDSDQLRKLIADIKTLPFYSNYPPFIALDQEGGPVKRLISDNFPAAFQLKDLTPLDTQKAFQQRSQLLYDLGINLNFGIVADIDNNPNSFIYNRVFGVDPEKVGNHVQAAIAGSKSLTLTTIKHFPGHGRSVSDSHTTIPVASISSEIWQATDAIPFKKGIDAGTTMVMFGHLRYPLIDDQPASLSRKWHDVLVKEMKYKGLTITDDMGMLENSGMNPYTSAIQAIQAGNDMLLYVNTKTDFNLLNTQIQAAVASGQIKESQIDASVKKILTIRKKLSE